MACLYGSVYDFAREDHSGKEMLHWQGWHFSGQNMVQFMTASMVLINLATLC
jgi:hypothetical protein